MKTNYLFDKVKYILYILSLALIITACSDDDDPLTESPDHFGAIGMQFSNSGIEVARIIRGETSDTLEAPLGELSDHFEIMFYNEEEQLVDPPEGGEHTLGWEVADETKLEVWQHEGEEGGFEFHLRGLAEGETTIEFFVVHEGHNDFRSNPIPVKIHHDDHAHEHFEAIGMQFSNSGIELARILRGVTTDTLEAPLGAISDHFEIKFFNEDEQLIDPPDGEHYTLGWEITDESKLAVWQHEGEEGGFEFHLRGLAEGVTTIEFFVVHEGHNDFRSGQIPVEIHHDEHAHGEPVGFKVIDEDSGNILVTANADGTVTGTLNLNNGETTDHLEVEFFDENGVEFQPQAPPHGLFIESANTNIVTITGQEEEEPYAFKLTGVAAGTTTITIGVMHDGSLEESFSPVTVNVN